MRFQGELVDLVLRNAMSLRHLCGRLAELHSIASQAGSLGRCSVKVGRALGGAANNESHLTPHV